MKQRRNFWQWLADKAKVHTRLTQEEWLSAFRMGAATVVPKRADMSTLDYRNMLNEQAGAAYARLLAKPPSVIQAEPPTFNALQASNDAFRRRNAEYAADIPTQHGTPAMRLARIKAEEEHKAKGQSAPSAEFWTWEERTGA